MPEPEVEKKESFSIADKDEVVSLLRRLLAEHQAADHAFTNRMVRGVCHTLIVTQITVMLTALGTGIGALLHVEVPFKGAAWGMIIGWSLGMLFVFYQKRMANRLRNEIIKKHQAEAAASNDDCVEQNASDKSAFVALGGEPRK